MQHTYTVCITTTYSAFLDSCSFNIHKMDFSNCINNILYCNTVITLYSINTFVVRCFDTAGFVLICSCKFFYLPVKLYFFEYKKLWAIICFFFSYSLFSSNTPCIGLQFVINLFSMHAFPFISAILYQILIKLVTSLYLMHTL